MTIILEEELLRERQWSNKVKKVSQSMVTKGASSASVSVLSERILETSSVVVSSRYENPSPFSPSIPFVSFSYHSKERHSSLNDGDEGELVQ
jgi:hypothetical protein